MENGLQVPLLKFQIICLMQMILTDLTNAAYTVVFEAPIE